jgi:hypothetical protein
MYCPQCGQTNDDSSKFCVKCGMDLEKYKEQWWEGKTPPTSTAGPAPGPASAGTPPPEYAPTGYPPPYAQQYQPPYGAPPYYQQMPAYGMIPNIPSYMGWAIATLILCFWPTGIVAVVYASKVGNRLALGDVVGAQEASRKAKLWCWITFAIGVAIVVIAIIASLLAAATVTIY